MELNVKRLHPDAKLPEKGSEGAGGWDLFANEDADISHKHPLSTGKKLVGTGIAMEIPFGYVGIIKDRSGRSTSTDLETFAGVIDADYRGEVKVAFRNHSNDHRRIAKGDKIAQMVIVALADITRVNEVEELTTTVRQAAGFGSTDGGLVYGSTDKS